MCVRPACIKLLGKRSCFLKMQLLFFVLHIVHLTFPLSKSGPDFFITKIRLDIHMYTCVYFISRKTQFSIGNLKFSNFTRT